jgi:hypothetical protein
VSISPSWRAVGIAALAVALSAKAALADETLLPARAAVELLDDVSDRVPGVAAPRLRPANQRRPRFRPAWAPAQGLADILDAIDDAALEPDLSTLAMLLGALEAARDRCLRTIGARFVSGHPAEPSQAAVGAAGTAGRVCDQWIPPKVAAARMGRSARWLDRRRRRPPYSSFCIDQEPRGYMVSERGLDEFMERERGRR